MKRVAVLGPKGTNGHEVARTVLKVEDDNIIFCVRNEEILETCMNEKVLGVVPVENASAGLVSEVVRGFWLRHIASDVPLQVVGEVQIPITHSLLVQNSCTDMRLVQTIKSHPQALAQCSKFLKEIGAQTLPASSTAAAAKEVMGESSPHLAAIASAFAAGIYGLSILRQHIEDYSGNATRFHILGHDSVPVTESDRTAVIFELPDEPRALVNVLWIIGSLNVNLSSIHSIPLGNPGVYAFYCEFDLHQDSDVGRKIIACMRELCKRMKVLGSYPQGDK